MYIYWSGSSMASHSYKNKTIVTVNSKEITENAGLLNCISWED